VLRHLIPVALVVVSATVTAQAPQGCWVYGCYDQCFVLDGAGQFFVWQYGSPWGMLTATVDDAGVVWSGGGGQLNRISWPGPTAANWVFYNFGELIVAPRGHKVWGIEMATGNISWASKDIAGPAHLAGNILSLVGLPGGIFAAASDGHEIFVAQATSGGPTVTLLAVDVNVTPMRVRVLGTLPNTMIGNAFMAIGPDGDLLYFQAPWIWRVDPQSGVMTQYMSTVGIPNVRSMAYEAWEDRLMIGSGSWNLYTSVGGGSWTLFQSMLLVRPGYMGDTRVRAHG